MRISAFAIFEPFVHVVGFSSLVLDVIFEMRVFCSSEWREEAQDRNGE
jgi:hypothetical protein